MAMPFSYCAKYLGLNQPTGLSPGCTQALWEARPARMQPTGIIPIKLEVKTIHLEWFNISWKECNILGE